MMWRAHRLRRRAPRKRSRNRCAGTSNRGVKFQSTVSARRSAGEKSPILSTSSSNAERRGNVGFKDGGCFRLGRSRTKVSQLKRILPHQSTRCPRTRTMRRSTCRNQRSQTETSNTNTSNSYPSWRLKIGNPARAIEATTRPLQNPRCRSPMVSSQGFALPLRAKGMVVVAGMG